MRLSGFNQGVEPGRHLNTALTAIVKPILPAYCERMDSALRRHVFY